MYDDYISRQAAIEALGEEPQCWIDAKYNCGPRDKWRWDIKSISEVPAADVRPVVRAEWVSKGKTLGAIFRCSNCGEETWDTVMGNPRWKYCPMCGSQNGGDAI